MKVSIITAVLNGAETIEDTIRSVIAQTHPRIEHIVVDGGSTDGTLDILAKYNDRIKVITGCDNGLYDAMNEGISYATGDIVGILNSDDFLFSQTVIEDIVRSYKIYDTDACYGNVIFCDRKDKNRIRRYWRAGMYHNSKLRFGWIPPHPSFYVKRECYDKFGLYRTDLSIAADYELMLRFFKKYGISSTFLDQTIVCMRVGGCSSKNIIRRLTGLYQVYKSWHLNRFPIPLSLFMRVPRKLFQFFNV